MNTFKLTQVLKYVLTVGVLLKRVYVVCKFNYKREVNILV